MDVVTGEMCKQKRQEITHPLPGESIFKRPSTPSISMAFQYKQPSTSKFVAQDNAATMSQQVVIQQPLTQVLIPPGNMSPGSQAPQSSSSQSSIPTLKVTQPVAGPSGIKNAPLTQYQISPTPYSVVSLGQSQHETSDEQPKTVVLGMYNYLKTSKWIELYLLLLYIVESIPSQAMQQEIEPIYCSENGIIYLTNTEEQQSNLENHVLTGKSQLFAEKKL